jgi:hypothetical protein
VAGARVKLATFEEMQRIGNETHPTAVRNLIGGAAHFFHRCGNYRWHCVLAWMTSGTSRRVFKIGWTPSPSVSPSRVTSGPHAVI